MIPDPTSFFLKGILAGLALAMPVGPVAVLCIRRTLAEGARMGFATDFGASLADGFYGLAAALGLTAISGFLLA